VSTIIADARSNTIMAANSGQDDDFYCSNNLALSQMYHQNKHTSFFIDPNQAQNHLFKRLQSLLIVRALLNLRNQEVLSEHKKDQFQNMLNHFGTLGAYDLAQTNTAISQVSSKFATSLEIHNCIPRRHRFEFKLDPQTYLIAAIGGQTSSIIEKLQKKYASKPETEFQKNALERLKLWLIALKLLRTE
jgi:hypothetical protein